MTVKRVLNVKHLRKILIVFMCFVVASTLMASSGLFKHVDAVTIQEQQKQLKDVNEKKTKTKAEEKEITERIYKKAREVETIEASINEQSAKIQATHNEIDRKKVELKEKTENLEIRLRTIYKKGSVGFVEVILNSDNISELISNMSFMQKIYRSDKAAISSVKKDQAQLESIRQRLKEEEEVLSAQKEESLKAKKALEEDKGEIEKRLKQFEAEAKQLGNEIASAQAALEAKMQAEAAQRAAQANAAANSPGSSNSQANPGTSAPYVSGTGQLGWPTRGLITSEFGFRPMFGDFHTGLDIAVPMGTPIHAADSGVVLLTGWMPNGYGNYVVIYHGNDISTLYAHNSSLAVSKGQNVTKGQVIAYAGSTGWSTGPHCHFEVRVKDQPVNPRGYL